MTSDPSGPLIYIILGLLLILSAIFAGSESAFSSCNKHKLLVLKEDGNKLAKISLKILDRFDKTLITDLIMVNICHVLLSVLTTVLFVMKFGDSGSLISTIVVTLVVFFFAEILPKNIATLNADKWALIFAPFIYFFLIILTPISFIFGALLKVTQKTFNLEEEEDTFDDEDLIDVIESKEDEGIIDSEESDIIQAAIEFGDIKIKEVYTKINDVTAIDINKATNEYLDSFLSNNTYSRIPVYDKTLDNIIGILHVRTYLKQRFTKGDVDIKQILSKPYFVSTQSKIDDIFEELKENRVHLAIVKNKNKNIGIITLKDILEELVDDIDDLEDEER